MHMYMPTPMSMCRARAYRVADESDLTSPSAFVKSPASGADSSAAVDMNVAGNAESDSSDEEFESKKQKGK